MGKVISMEEYLRNKEKKEDMDREQEIDDLQCEIDELLNMLQLDENTQPVIFLAPAGEDVAEIIDRVVSEIVQERQLCSGSLEDPDPHKNN